MSVRMIGRYEVHSDGTIVGLGGQPLKPCTVRGGYQQVLIYMPGQRRRTTRVHVLVCEAFHGPRPTPKHHAAHWDGDPQNNAASNLRWATAKENIHDKVRHGRVTRTSGEVNGMSRLTEDDIPAIRALAGSGVSQRQIAARFGVSQPTISDIITGRSWGHL